MGTGDGAGNRADPANWRHDFTGPVTSQNAMKRHTKNLTSWLVSVGESESVCD